MPGQRWEYTVLKIEPGGLMGGKVNVEELNRALNAYGVEQWELASTFETNLGDGRSRDVVLIFKRPV